MKKRSHSASVIALLPCSMRRAGCILDAMLGPRGGRPIVLGRGGGSGRKWFAKTVSRYAPAEYVPLVMRLPALDEYASIAPSLPTFTKSLPIPSRSPKHLSLPYLSLTAHAAASPAISSTSGVDGLRRRGCLPGRAEVIFAGCNLGGGGRAIGGERGRDWRIGRRAWLGGGRAMGLGSGVRADETRWAIGQGGGGD